MSQTVRRWAWFKVGGLLVCILFFLVFYLITINNVSTKGYYLRQSIRELDNVKFYHNVALFQSAIAKKQLWDRTNTDFIGQRDTRAQRQQTNVVRITIEE